MHEDHVARGRDVLQHLKRDPADELGPFVEPPDACLAGLAGWEAARTKGGRRARDFSRCAAAVASSVRAHSGRKRAGKGTRPRLVAAGPVRVRLEVTQISLMGSLYFRSGRAPASGRTAPRTAPTDFIRETFTELPGRGACTTFPRPAYMATCEAAR